MLERLKKLSDLTGVSGNEGEIRSFLKSELSPLCDETFTDAVGNLYFHKIGEGTRIMLDAHMDEVGMIVTGVTDAGTLLFASAGIDPRVLVSKRVVIGKENVNGVIGAKAIHLQEPDERRRALKVSQLYVDIGAKDKEDALKYVSPGDYISFTTKCEDFGEGLIKGKALDDRVGCTVVAELMKNRYDCDLWGVFSVQEELGLRGAKVTGRRVQPDLALILEGTTANDVAATPSHRQVTCVGQGAAISFRDGATVVPERMVKALVNCAKENGIPYQYRRGTSGGTDAGMLHRTGSGILCGGISVPCRYIHSPVSVCAKSDIDAAYRLADAFLTNRCFEGVLKNV